MRPTNIVFAPVAFLAAIVSAAPHAIWAPTVTSPTTGDVWPIGTIQTVKWDTSDAPGQISNPVGEIYIRDYVTQLTLTHLPLATGFDILDGEHNITVPNVPVGQYQIVLMGHSGNWGSAFEVTKAE